MGADADALDPVLAAGRRVRPIVVVLPGGHGDTGLNCPSRRGAGRAGRAWLALLARSRRLARAPAGVVAFLSAVS